MKHSGWSRAAYIRTAVGLLLIVGCAPSRPGSLGPVLEQAPTFACADNKSRPLGVPCPQSGVVDFGFDGVTGQRDSVTHFQQHDAVRIVVRDVNPFLFKYSIAMQNIVLPEAAPSQFFSALQLGFTAPSGSAASPPLAASVAPGTAAQEATYKAQWAKDPNFLKSLKLTPQTLAPLSVPDVQRKAAQQPESVVKLWLPSTQQAVVTPITCADSTAEFKSLDDDVQRLKRMDEDAAAQLQTAQQSFGALETAWGSARDTLFDARKRAPDVQAAATGAAKALTTVVLETDGAARAVNKVIGSIAALGSQATGRANQLGTECAAQSPYTDAVVAYIKTIFDDTVRFGGALNSLAAMAESMRQAAVILTVMASDPQQYYKAHLLPGFTAPTDVPVTVSRTIALAVDLAFAPSSSTKGASDANGTGNSTPAGTVTVATTTVVTPQQAPATSPSPTPSRTPNPAATPTSPTPAPGTPTAGKSATGTPAPKTTTAAPATSVPPPYLYSPDSAIQARLNFGGSPRVVISAGFFAANIPARQYAPITRVATPTAARPADTTTTVIGPATVSPWRATPMLTLNTRVDDGPWHDMNFFATIGAGVRTAGASDLDYLAGLTVMGWDQRFGLTVGGYFGQTNVLAGGSHTGDLLSAGTTTVQTQTRLVVNWGIGLSLRVLPWGGTMSP